MPNKTHAAFTLAELLIALAILGVIATFTIPKILQSQQDGRNNAIAKETMSSISAAFQRQALQTGITATTGSKDFTPYLNYVATDTATTVDDVPSGGTDTCSPTVIRCLRLHNGGMLVYQNGETFNGTASTNGVWFVIDPDGTTSNAKGLAFLILYNGRLVSPANGDPLTVTSSNNTYGWAPQPSWFSW